MSKNISILKNIIEWIIVDYFGTAILVSPFVWGAILFNMATDPRPIAYALNFGICAHIVCTLFFGTVISPFIVLECIYDENKQTRTAVNGA